MTKDDLLENCVIGVGCDFSRQIARIKDVCEKHRLLNRNKCKKNLSIAYDISELISKNHLSQADTLAVFELAQVILSEKVN